jgi:spore germination cell wall hydrolase CwlJ-like protein
MRLFRLPTFLVAPVIGVAVTLSIASANIRSQFEAPAVDLEAQNCLALNVYWEARSEPELGQQAVAAVTLNRVKSEAFPNDVCAVVRQGGERRNRCQFSWWCDGKKDDPNEIRAWDNAQRIARAALTDQNNNQQMDDPTHGALFYHATYVKPTWAERMVKTKRIGQHIFFVHTPQKNPMASTQMSQGEQAQSQIRVRLRAGEVSLASLN